MASGNLVMGDESNPEFMDEDWEAWICSSCAKRMKLVKR